MYSLATTGNNIFAGTYGSGIYFSANNGTNWTQIGLNNLSVYSLATIGNNIFAGTWNSGVYLSTNNGLNWTQTTLNNKNVRALTAGGNNIFAGTDSNGVYLSTNNGANWINKNQGFNVISTIGALLISNNYIFSGTYGNSVWRRSLSEIIGIKNISTEIPMGFSLNQNYPNPFNPSTKISFQLPVVSFSSLKIFDITGKEVATLVNKTLKPGTYEATFNGASLTSGVYFYRLTTDGFSETKKLILMK